MQAPVTGQLSWFDFSVRDFSKAQPFYKGLFAWDFEAMGPSYMMIKVEGKNIGGINLDPNAKPCVGFTPYFNVPSITEARGLTTKLGGKLVGEPVAINGGEMGYFQNFTDLDGNTLAFWSMKN